MKDQKDFTGVIKKINSIDELGLEANVKKTVLWFFLSFAALLLSLEFLYFWLNIFNGDPAFKQLGFTVKGFGFFLFIFVVCVGYTLYSLFNSKNAAAKAYTINFIIPDNYKNDMEKGLYGLVVSAAKKTNLTKVPAVGIYDSAEVNAFATGPNRDDSIVAFSSGLLDTMSEEEIGAVACHEIAHIANGDMVSMSVIGGAVKAFSCIIQIPLTFFTFLMAGRDEHGRRNYIGLVCSLAIQWVVFRICNFLGNLLMNFFSRQREYSADKMSAQILGKDQMINALKNLEKTMSIPLPQLTEEQAALSTLKICSAYSFLDIFSTHPTIDKRIERLNEISL